MVARDNNKPDPKALQTIIIIGDVSQWNDCKVRTSSEPYMCPECGKISSNKYCSDGHPMRRAKK